MKLFRNILLLLALIVAAGATATAREVADVPNVHVADRTQYVSNPDGVLGSEAVSRLNGMLGGIWEQTTAEPVVVAIASLPDDTDIDTYATKLFEAWGIGKKDKDNGVLMVIARDNRKAVIRTGYGVEGVLPDITCGRILRDTMFPLFKQSDYDAGTIAGVEAMARVLTDPAYAAELRSSHANDEADFRSPVTWEQYLGLSGIVALAMLIIVIWRIRATRKEDAVTRYAGLHRLFVATLIVTFLTLGMGIVAAAVLRLAMHRIRNRRTCPNCGHKMKKIDEEHDNDYLTPAQDTEERINSVDYDVWVCPNCRETDILPYVNKATSYTECPHCGSRACTLTSDRIVLRPTTRSNGRGERVYTCLNCRHASMKPYIIPMVVAPIVIGGPGGRGGGGFSGGSFGGGLTGGGGASGGW